MLVSSSGEKEVAIKIPKLTISIANSSEEVEKLKAFYSEAQIAVGFEHKNILACLGISTGRSTMCFMQTYRDSSWIIFMTTHYPLSSFCQLGNGLNCWFLHYYLTILGAAGEPWLVVEFMMFGDLADILRTNSGVISFQNSNVPNLKMVRNWKSSIW